MQRRTFLTTGLAAGLWAGGARANDRAARAEDLFARFRREAGVADASVVVMRGDERLYESYAGAYGPGVRIPIASSSKWMFGALVMSLVDDRLLALDAPIGTYLPELPPAYAALRLDALMSYTAGLAGLRELIELRQPPGITLLDSALDAARRPLAHPPGTRFDYGGPNFQFVGAAAERVARKSWHDLFAARIAGPLGMAATGWGRLRTPPDPRAPAPNPVLQAGVWTTLPDYSAFLTMIAQDGALHGRRVLSPGAMAAMGRIMTLGLPKGDMAGASMGPAEYMIAHWCERLEAGRCTLESSPGYYGAYPWIDRSRRLHGLILVQDQRRRIVGPQTAFRDGLIEVFA